MAFDEKDGEHWFPSKTVSHGSMVVGNTARRRLDEEYGSKEDATTGRFENCRLLCACRRWQKRILLGCSQRQPCASNPVTKNNFYKMRNKAKRFWIFFLMQSTASIRTWVSYHKTILARARQWLSSRRLLLELYSSIGGGEVFFPKSLLSSEQQGRTGVDAFSVVRCSRSEAHCDWLWREQCRDC